MSGAGLNPQFPTTSVVTPWWILLSPAGQRKSGQIGMGVHVDEAGADDAAARVDPLPGRRRGEVADRLDPPPPDADVGPVGAGAGAVHHESAGQRAIEVHRAFLPPPRRRREALHPSGEPRIEEVPQAVAQEVDREHRRGQEEPGNRSSQNATRT